MHEQLATGPQGRNEPARPRGDALYCITFRDGRSITTTAPNSVAAEAKACRQHAGLVRRVIFLRRTA